MISAGGGGLGGGQRRGRQHGARARRDHDVARRLRRRAEPERRRPARGGRGGAARVGVPAADLPARAGREGGETGVDDDVVAETFADLGATIMGRNMFGGGPGPWGERPLDRVVGARPAVSHAGVRPDPPPPRAAPDAGRHDLPLRHRRHRAPRSSGRPRRPATGTSTWPAAPTRPASTWRPGWSTCSRCTSSRRCSAPARASSTSPRAGRTASSPPAWSRPRAVAHYRYRRVRLSPLSPCR